VAPFARVPPALQTRTALGATPRSLLVFPLTLFNKTVAFWYEAVGGCPLGPPCRSPLLNLELSPGFLVPPDYLVLLRFFERAPPFPGPAASSRPLPFVSFFPSPSHYVTVLFPKRWN